MFKQNDKKVFVIINSYFIGDILLTNSLIKNIKTIYPESLVVMLTSPAFVDVAKYQEGVDDVIVWDRHGLHHGAGKMFKFIKDFPYKKIFAAFPIYGMDRPMILAKLLGAKYILAPKRKGFAKFLIKSKYKIQYSYGQTQEEFNSLLSGITRAQVVNYPIQYNVPELETEVLQNLPNDYITLCPISSRREKDMPFETVIDIVRKLNNRKIVLLGKGKISQELSQLIRKENFQNLIDLTDKTTIVESAAVLKKSQCVVSVDTGLLHLSCALNTPTLALFYTEDTKSYVPNEKIYNCKLLNEKSSNNIVTAIENLFADKL